MTTMPDTLTDEQIEAMSRMPDTLSDEDMAAMSAPSSPTDTSLFQTSPATLKGNMTNRFPEQGGPEAPPRPGLVEQAGKTIADSSLEALQTMGNVAAYLPFRLSRLLPEGKAKDAITKAYRDVESRSQEDRKKQQEALALPPAQSTDIMGVPVPIEQAVRGVAGVVPFAALTGLMPGAGLGVGVEGAAGVAMRAGATAARWGAADVAMGGGGEHGAAMGAGMSLIESLPLPKSAKFFLESGGFGVSTYWATGDIQEAIAAGAIPGIFRAGRWTAKAATEIRKWAQTPEGAKQVASTPEGRAFAEKPEPTRADVEAVFGEGVYMPLSERVALRKIIKQIETRDWQAGKAKPKIIDRPREPGKLTPEEGAAIARGPEGVRIAEPEPTIVDAVAKRAENKAAKQKETPDAVQGKQESGEKPVDQVTPTAEVRRPQGGDDPTAKGAEGKKVAELPPDLTSIKNAVTEARRQEFGLSGRDPVTQRSHQETFDSALFEISRNRDLPDNLIKDLEKAPRPLTDREGAILLARQMELEQRLRASHRQMEEAERAGDRASSTSAAEVANRTLQDLERIYGIDEKVGTEASLGFSFRQMMAATDFSLSRMLNNARAANHGRPLDADQQKVFTELADRLSKNQERLTKLEEENRLLRVQQVIDQTIKTPKPPKEKSKNRLFTDQAANAALARLKARFSGEKSSGGLDIESLKDMATYGGWLLEKGVRDFAGWSRNILDALGENVKPYLEEAWKASRAELGNRIRTQKREKIQARVDKGESITNLHAQVREMAIEFVRDGIHDREALNDAVWKELRQIDPNITREQTINLIGGYGVRKPLDPDADKARLREIRQEDQLISKIMSMEKGAPPLASGPERQKLTDEGRRLTKLVNELKRRGGFNVTDPATQLRSALESIATRLDHDIADVSHEIRTGERIVNRKSVQLTSPEIEAKRSILKELRAQRDEIFEAKGIAEKERAQRAIKVLDKGIADYERYIKNKDFGPHKKQGKKVTSQEIEAKKKKLESLREEWKALRDAANPGRADMIALQSYKSRLANETARIKDRMARGDYTEKPRREVKPDAEAIRIKAENAQIKAKYHDELAKIKWRNATRAQKLAYVAIEALALQRSIKTSVDLSAPLRQGLIQMVIRPVTGIRSIPDMLRSLRSEDRRRRVDEEIKAREMYGWYSRAGLELAEHGKAFTRMEEGYQSHWADKVHGVAMSERAYTTYLNRLRADSFDRLFGLFKKTFRRDPTLSESQAIANWVNITTGRGKVGSRAAQAAVGMNMVFFAPRLVLSRFQVLLGQPFLHGSNATRLLIATEYARFLAGAALVYGLASLHDEFSVTFDWRSSDFGKIRFGDTRIDMLGGLSQVTTFIGRSVTGEKKLPSGEVQPIRGKVPFGKGDAEKVLFNFVRSKLSPVFGIGMDIYTGRTYDYQPTSAKTIAQSALVPLSVDDILEIMQKENVARGVALSMLIMFGAGVKNYSKPDIQKKTETKKARTELPQSTVPPQFRYWESGRSQPSR